MVKVTTIIDRGPDPAGEILGTRYRRYTSACGIHGLYRDDGEKINLLAVEATNPGTGQFRRFIQSLKTQYTIICVWWVENPFLGVVLGRYGFKPETEVQGDGEVLQGFRWDMAEGFMK